MLKQMLKVRELTLTHATVNLLILAFLIICDICGVYSYVPDNLGITPFLMQCSIYPLADRKANMDSLKHVMHVFRGVLSRAMGLKLEVRLVTFPMNKNNACLLPTVRDFPRLLDNVEKFSYV